MTLQTNQIRPQSTIEIADIEAWLDKHPARKAENLTGRMVDDKIIRKLNKSTKAIAPVEALSQSKVSPTAQKRKHACRGRYDAIQEQFIADIKAGKLVKVERFSGINKPAMFAIVSRVRAVVDVLTLANNNKSVVGWVSVDILNK